MFNNNSKISFIIPAYNSADTVEQSVDSIFNGNFEEGDEVIIVNDASTDNTPSVLSKLKMRYPEMQILEHHINKKTAAAARNTAIDVSKNELIFTLDSDNVLVPNSIKKLKEYLFEQKAGAAVFGEIWFFRENTNNVAQKWTFDKEITVQDPLSTHITPCPTGNYLFTKESWLKAGRYFEPTILNQTLDSWTFGVRQLFTGTKMVALPNTHYLHRTGINSHWVRENKSGNVSLSALVAILPFLEKIEERDVEYIFNKESRLAWFDRLEERPIHVKNRSINTRAGEKVKFAPKKTALTTTKSAVKRILSLFAQKAIPYSPAGIHAREVAKWKADNAEEKRYLYDLTADSVVFDMGGYEGQFASDLYSRYRSKTFIFEPVKQFAENIKKRFINNPNIVVYPYGLSDKTEEVKISLDKNSSSLFLSGTAYEKVHMKKASDFFRDYNIYRVDLMKINIEGGEYALLEDLIMHDFVKKITNLQIQFHTFVPNAEMRMKKIQEALSRTHHLTYQYPFVWENWEKN